MGYFGRINIRSARWLTRLLVKYPEETTKKCTPVTTETKWPLPSPLWHSRSPTLPLLLPLPFRSGPSMLTTARSVLCLVLLVDGILTLYSRSPPFDPSSPSAARFPQCSTNTVLRYSIRLSQVTDPCAEPNFGQGHSVTRLSAGGSEGSQDD
jgi:hypothetical protein